MQEIELESKHIEEREVKLMDGWKVVYETDSPGMFAPHIPDILLNWSDWQETFIYRPRKSVYGKVIWGKVYRRAIMNGWDKVELMKEHPEWEEQWATKKEVFRCKLDGC